RRRADLVYYYTRSFKRCLVSRLPKRNHHQDAIREALPPEPPLPTRTADVEEEKAKTKPRVSVRQQRPREKLRTGFLPSAFRNRPPRSSRTVTPKALTIPNRPDNFIGSLRPRSVYQLALDKAHGSPLLRVQVGHRSVRRFIRQMVQANNRSGRAD